VSLITVPIQLPAFEGPLDLLLQLIEREELDITAISLLQVADQYLAVLEEMGRQGMADLTAFLVVAAKLVLIKSQALLPRSSSGAMAPEEDVAADLLRQLEEYRRFKRAAQELARWQEEGQQAYVRLSPAPAPQRTFDLGHVTLEALLVAAQEVLHTRPTAPVNDVTQPATITVAHQVHRIERHLRSSERIYFHDVLSEAATKVEVIVTLLAVLQMLKEDRLRVWQEELFGPIFIAAREPETPATNDEVASPQSLQDRR
jgi:segregation and condensation protein A